MNLQQQFDYVVNNLRQQGTCSIDEDLHGLYQTSENVRCPGGWFLSNKFYSSSFEGQKWEDVVSKLAKRLPSYLIQPESIRLIEALQSAHDAVGESDVPFFTIEEHFRKIAKDFEVNYDPPK